MLCIYPIQYTLFSLLIVVHGGKGVELCHVISNIISVALSFSFEQSVIVTVTVELLDLI